MYIWQIAQEGVHYKINVEQILWIMKEEQANSIAIFMSGAPQSQPLVLHGAEAELFWNEFKANREIEAPRRRAN